MKTRDRKENTLAKHLKTHTRGKQHHDEYRKQSSESVLWRHCQERHNNERQEFTMRVIGQYRNDIILRQIAESVRINNSNPDSCINNKTEWNLVRFPTIRVDNGGAD